MVVQHEGVDLWMMDLMGVEEGMSPSELLPVVVQYEGVQTPGMEEGMSPSEQFPVVVQGPGVQTPWMSAQWSVSES